MPRRQNRSREEALHDLVALVPSEAAITNDPVTRPGFRETRRDDLDLHPQGIARTHRHGPTQLIDRATDDATSDLHRSDKQPHRDGRGLPATGGQTAEQVLAWFPLQMERLRIEFPCKLDDLRCGNRPAVGDEAAPDRKILKRARHLRSIATLSARAQGASRA
ncbi:MAG TPA: hypothetical protein VGI85_00725 [Chthoniobacterales bacterium]